MSRIIAMVMFLVFSGGLAMAEHGNHTQSPAISGTVSLDVYATPGRLHLLTASGSPAVLEYRSSSDGGENWSTPIPVGTGQPSPDPIHRGMDAQIAATSDGQYLLAAWTTAGTLDRFGRGPIATSLSSDAGKTWHPGPNPADDNLATGHAFLDLACDPSGSFHLVWLDGRDKGDAGGKGLRYARSDNHGQDWTRNKTLDPITCECCWNTLLTGPAEKGVSVLYRDAGPRDMAMIQSNDNGKSWLEPVSVGGFHWDVNVCPHVGGGLAILPDKRTLLATVWTGTPEQAGAYLLRSQDAGKTWSSPTRLGGDRHAWHTDITADDQGHLAAVWDARTNGTSAIFATTSNDAGITWSTPIRLTGEAAIASHPRVVSTGKGFRVFWTEMVEGGDRSVWRSVPIGKEG